MPDPKKMKLGSTQRIVLENVAARRAPYAGHKSYAEYTRRMDVARQLEERGLLATLPVGHPGIRGARPGEVLASMYRLTEAGQAALDRPASSATSSPGARRKKSRQLDREIAEALAGKQSETGSAFHDFLIERFPSGDVPWSWVQRILKEHGEPLPLMTGLGKEEAAQYGIRQGKSAGVHQLARYLGY